MYFKYIICFGLFSFEMLSVPLYKELGYKPIIETKYNAVHIFMEIDNERVLLEDNQRKFVGKDGTYSFSYEELIE